MPPCRNPRNRALEFPVKAKHWFFARIRGTVRARHADKNPPPIIGYQTFSGRKGILELILSLAHVLTSAKVSIVGIFDQVPCADARARAVARASQRGRFGANVKHARSWTGYARSLEERIFGRAPGSGAKSLTDAAVRVGGLRDRGRQVGLPVQVGPPADCFALPVQCARMSRPCGEGRLV